MKKLPQLFAHLTQCDSTTLQSNLPRRVSAAILLLVLSLFGSHSFAEPTVEGIDLVSSIRVDRTNFDYKYSIRFRVDSNSYADSTFTVASSATSTPVMKNVVNLGTIDAGSFGRSQDTFVIRQNRTVPFDPKSLTFSFFGTLIGAASEGSEVQIGSVVFMEQAGRPGHEGTFPIQSESPPSGSNLVMKVDIVGKPSAVSYRLIDTLGQPLGQGFLTGTADIHESSTAFYSTVIVPSQPFRVQITATPANGGSVSWQSARLFNPPSFALEIAPTKALLKKSEAVSTKILIRSGSASGIYIVSLQTPLGFSGNVGPWTVQLTPGSTTEVLTSIIAPASGEDFEMYTITASVYPQGLSSQRISSNLRFTVR